MQVTKNSKDCCNLYGKIAPNENEKTDFRLLLKKIGVAYFCFYAQLQMQFHEKDVANTHSTLIELDNLLATGSLGYHTIEDINRLRLDLSEMVLCYFVSAAQNNTNTNSDHALEVTYLFTVLIDYLSTKILD